MKAQITLAFAIAALLPSLPQAQSPEDNLKARFVGRQGSASEDRRVNLHDLRTPFGPGPKTGCKGDTLNAGVTINKVDTKVNGNVANIVANYSGKYTRQGWIAPCIHSPPPNGREDRNVHGTISINIKQIPFQYPEVTWEETGGFGEVSHPEHDSNKLALEAAKNAIKTAF